MVDEVFGMKGGKKGRDTEPPKKNSFYLCIIKHLKIYIHSRVCGRLAQNADQKFLIMIFYVYLFLFIFCLIDKHQYDLKIFFPLNEFMRCQLSYAMITSLNFKWTSRGREGGAKRRTQLLRKIYFSAQFTSHMYHIMDIYVCMRHCR